MKALFWFLGGLVACLVLQVVLLHGDGRRLEMSVGPEPSTSAPANRRGWGLELKLVEEGEHGEAVLQPSAVREPVLREPLAGLAGRVPGASGRLRANPPPPERKWLRSPFLEEHYGNGQLHFKVRQVRDDGRWVREGPWEAWHENGVLHEEGAYVRGREQGEWRWWYDNEKPMARGRFVEGKRVGPWTFWHENGALMMEGQYEDGEGAGVWAHYDEAGNQVSVVEFVDGEVVGGSASVR